MGDHIIKRIWKYQVSDTVGMGIVVLVFLLSCGSLWILNQIGRSERRAQFRVGAASGDIGAWNSALALYHADTKRFPTTLTQLLADNAPGWSGPYLATINLDPWGNAYFYTGGGSNYTIISIHPNDSHRAETIRYILSEGTLSTLP